MKFLNLFRRRPLEICPECQWEKYLLNQWHQSNRLLKWQDWAVEKAILPKNLSAATSARKPPAPMVSSPARPKPWRLIVALMLPASVRRGLKKSSPLRRRLSRLALRQRWKQWRVRLMRRLMLWLVCKLIRFCRGRLMISANARLNSLNSAKPGGLTATPSGPLKVNCLGRWLKRLPAVRLSRPVVKNLCPRHRR